MTRSSSVIRCMKLGLQVSAVGGCHSRDSELRSGFSILYNLKSRAETFGRPDVGDAGTRKTTTYHAAIFGGRSQLGWGKQAYY
jgi:hypothetical protein